MTIFINTKQLLFTLCSTVLLLSGGAQGQFTIPTPIQESTNYGPIVQELRTFNFYSFQVFNKTAAFLNSNYLAIRLDIEDSTSEPDLFISKTFVNPRSEFESDQFCVRAGSQLCVIRRNSYKSNDFIYVGVRCIGRCSYSLRVIYMPVISIGDGNRTLARLEGRSASVYQFQIPESSTEGLISSVQFSVETNSTTNNIQLSLSVTDDLSIVEERDQDIVIDNGKAIRFTSDDIGWCTRCTVSFIVSVRSQDTYQITARTSARRDLLVDQQTVARVIEQQQRECFSYNVARPTSDVMFLVRQQQGDAEISLAYRNAVNQTNELQVIMSEQSAQRGIIARASDRQRALQPTGLLSLCATPFMDSSLQILASAQFANGRFDALDDTLYTFNLDSQDYIYFRFSGPLLSQPRQIQVQVQSFNGSFNVPRVYFRTCNSPNLEECSLTDNQAMGFMEFNFMLSELNSTVDNMTLTRTGVINHSPLACAVPTSCHYLISVFNPERTEVQRHTFRLNVLNPEPIQIQINQQYQDIAIQGSLTQFQLNFTPLQLQTMNISRVLFNLTSFNGRADLYLSTVGRPTPTNFEQRSRTLSPWNRIAFNASNRDLRSTSIFVSVHANTLTAYTLRVTPVFTQLNPSNLNTNMTQNQTVSNTTNATTNTNSTQPPRGRGNTLPQNFQVPQNSSTQLVIPTLFPENSRSLYDMNSSRPELVLFYQPNFNPNVQNKTIHFYPNIEQMLAPNSSVVFNVSYGNRTWANNSIGLSLTPAMWTLDMTQVFVIRIRADFSRVNRSLLNVTQIRNSQPNVTPQNAVLTMRLRLSIYAAQQQSEGLEYAQLDTKYEGFANNSFVVFKTLMLDSNGTYIFTLENSIGKPYFMQKNGRPMLQDFEITDDTTYDFASNTFDVYDTQVLNVTKLMRENANFRCRNGSYSIRGGNDNCTMFAAIQCKEVCVFNFSVTLVEAKTRSVPHPILFKEGMELQGNVNSSVPAFYYLPFIRGQVNETAIVLQKTIPQDQFIAARIISNAHLPYFQWSLPSSSSNDVLGRNAQSQSEIVDLSSNLLSSRCPANVSCALLICVYSANSTRSSFQLNFFSARNRIANSTMIKAQFKSNEPMHYYWFMINMTHLQRPNPVPWRHLITVATNSMDHEADLYIATNEVYYPSPSRWDFKGDRFGNDAVVLSSDLPAFRNSTQERILVTIGILPRGLNVSYNLMNWGPTPYDANFLNFTDIYFRQLQNVTLLPRQQRSLNNYRIFKFFNNGSRDFTINVTSIAGQVYVLANRQNFKEYDQNAYLSVPIIPQLSRTTPVNLNRTSMVLRVNPRSNANLLCNFCWIYIAVFQNSTLPTQPAIFTVNITDNSLLDLIPVMKPGDTWNQVIASSGSVIQRRFMLDSKDPFTIQVWPSSGTTSYQVYVGTSTDYLNTDRIWQSNSTNQRQTFVMKQSDRNFSLSTYYFVTVAARSNNLNVTVKLDQKRTVTLLRNGTTLLERMSTPEDYVKYYYFAPPRVATNFTATITISPRTQGFYPSFYAQRNDLLNMTFNYRNLKFPNLIDYTFQQEQQFYQPWQTNYTFSFNVSGLMSVTQIPFNVTQNVTVNQTQLVNVTTTVFNTTIKQNQTVVVQQNRTVQVNSTRNVTMNLTVTNVNQTYYTLALYWNNYGMSDIQRAEYEISYTMRPLGRNLVLQQQHDHSQGMVGSIFQDYLPSKFLQFADDGNEEGSTLLNSFFNLFQ